MDRSKAKDLLERRRQDLEEVARVATEQGSLDEAQGDSAGEVATYDQHPTDISTDTLEREVDLSVREGAEGRIEDIGRAFERLDKGTYGICATCKQPIPDERLEVRPEAEFCVDHQPTNGRPESAPVD